MTRLPSVGGLADHQTTPPLVIHRSIGTARGRHGDSGTLVDMHTIARWAGIRGCPGRRSCCSSRCTRPRRHRLDLHDVRPGGGPAGWEYDRNDGPRLQPDRPHHHLRHQGRNALPNRSQVGPRPGPVNVSDTFEIHYFGSHPVTTYGAQTTVPPCDRSSHSCTKIRPCPGRGTWTNVDQGRATMTNIVAARACVGVRPPQIGRQMRLPVRQPEHVPCDHAGRRP